MKKSIKNPLFAVALSKVLSGTVAILSYGDILNIHRVLFDFDNALSVCYHFYDKV